MVLLECQCTNLQRQHPNILYSRQSLFSSQPQRDCWPSCANLLYPLKIETKGETFQNHYHGEEENPSNFHQKLLSTNLRWGSFCKSFGRPTMATTITMARFTFVQVNDEILGPAPTSFNTGPCTHYFIATYM